MARPFLSHFVLPPGHVQIAFSGGRTSGFMLHAIAEANGGIPEDRVQVTFQNTGREMPQTLDFVAEVGRRWGIMITWLEYRPEAPFFEIVGHQGASRDGEPFEALIRRRKFLPNQQSRFCTEELKIRTAKRYLMSLGWRRWTGAVGIRADEPGRVNPRPKERRTPWYPLVAAGVSRHDIALFWRRQPFDLRLPSARGKTVLGNCDGCFLKSEAHVAMLARDHPERHAWWERMEEVAAGLSRSRRGACFSKRYSRRELREFVERQGDWIFDSEDALCQASGGECTE